MKAEGSRDKGTAGKSSNCQTQGNTLKVRSMFLFVTKNVKPGELSLGFRERVLCSVQNS